MLHCALLLTLCATYTYIVTSQNRVAQCSRWESCGEDEDSVTLLQTDLRHQSTVRSAGRLNHKGQDTNVSAVEPWRISVNRALAVAARSTSIGEGVGLQHFFHGERAGRFNHTKNASFSDVELDDISVSRVRADAASSASTGEGVGLRHFFHGGRAGRFNHTKNNMIFSAIELGDISASIVLANAASNATAVECMGLQYFFHGETWNAHRKLFIVLIVLGCVCCSSSIIGWIFYVLNCVLPASLKMRSIRVEGLGTCEHSNLLGGLIQKVAAEQGSKALGVTITIQSMKVHPARGIIEVNGLRVDNPEGWQTEYLLFAKHALVDLNMGKLAMSTGKTIVAERVEFEDIDVQYEKSSMTSNLNDLLDNLTAGKSKHKRKAAEHRQGSATLVTLEKVSARGIGCKVATSFSCGTGVQFEAGDIVYHNFSKTFGSELPIVDLKLTLLVTLLKSVIATAAGKKITEALSTAVEDIEGIVSPE